MKKRFLTLCACAAIVGFSGTARAQDLAEYRVITANDTSCSMYAQHVSRELGFNAKAGLDVTLISSDTTVPYIAFLPAGDAEAVMLDSAQVLQMANADQPGSVVYEVYQYAPDILAVMADSPIQSVADLKGKTIGLASDRDQITAIIALLSANLTIDDVSTAVVGSSGPLLAKALQDGTIDAFVGSTSDLTGIQAAGVETRNITPPQVVENPGNSWVIWDERRDELRDKTEGFLRGWAMAAYAGVLDTASVKAICRKVIPEQWENPASGHAMMQRTIYVTNLRRTVKFGELQPDVWLRVQKPLIALGEIKGEIPVEEFLDASFIDAANDFTTDDVKQAIAAWWEANPDAVKP